jgi:hypothetical protein
VGEGGYPVSLEVAKLHTTDLEIGLFGDFESVGEIFAGTDISTIVPVTGGTPPYAFSLAPLSDPMPMGMALDPVTGVFEGTTTKLETWNLIFRVTDDVGDHYDRPLIVTIVPFYPPTPTPISSEFIDVGLFYTKTLGLDEGWPPIVWSLDPFSDPLPAGMVLDPVTGVFEGTPSVVGTNHLIFRATDEGGYYGNVPFTLTVI